MIRKSITVTLLAVLAALVASGCAIDRSELATPEALRDLPPMAEETLEFEAAEDVLEPDAFDYTAVVETNKGTVTIELFDDEAPVTVNNFVFLAQEGFYDGTAWHRVVRDPQLFVIQGGDRNGFIAGRPGTGGPGYTWEDEAAALEIPHDGVGVLSMANAGPNTNGSQFFVTLAEGCCDHLNGRHAVFGQVASDADMEVVDSIRQGDVIVSVEIVTTEVES